MKFASNRCGTRVVLVMAAVAATIGNAVADEQYFDRMDKITSGAGNAPAHNIAVQTINPWPSYVHKDRINIDGQRINLAHKRYQANKSIPPRGLSTSSVLSAGGAAANDAGAGAPSGENNK